MQYRQCQNRPIAIKPAKLPPRYVTNEIRSRVMKTFAANNREQPDHGHRALYVLTASLALLVIGFIAVVLTV